MELEIKAAVRSRDGMRCTKCGVPNDEYKQARGRSLDVHRVVPGSKYTVEGCVTLCQPCHGPEPRQPRGKAVYNRGGKPVHLRVSPALHAAIEEFRQAQRIKPSMTAFVHFALKEFLQGEGQSIVAA